MSHPGDTGVGPVSASDQADQTDRAAGATLHKLRSPVTAIIGFADLLNRNVERGTATPELLRERLARIRSAAEQVDALLDALAEALRRERAPR